MVHTRIFAWVDGFSNDLQVESNYVQLSLQNLTCTPEIQFNAWCSCIPFWMFSLLFCKSFNPKSLLLQLYIPIDAGWYNFYNRPPALHSILQCQGMRFQAGGNCRPFCQKCSRNSNRTLQGDLVCLHNVTNSGILCLIRIIAHSEYDIIRVMVIINWPLQGSVLFRLNLVNIKILLSI